MRASTFLESLEQVYFNLAGTVYTLFLVLLGSLGMGFLFFNFPQAINAFNPRVFKLVGLLFLGEALALCVAFALLSGNDAALALAGGNVMMFLFALIVLPAGLCLNAPSEKKTTPKIVALVGLIGGVVALAISIALLQVLDLFIDLTHGEVLDPLMESDRALIGFSLIALMAAPLEEIVFRMGAQSGLEAVCEKFGVSKWCAIIAVAGFFALGHAGMIDPNGIKEVQILAVGCIFGYLKIQYGLSAAILAHLVLNASTLVIEFGMRLLGTG